MRQKPLITSIVCLAALTLLVGVRVSAAWIDPPGSLPPNGFPSGFVLPLNTTSSAQTKAGQLTVNRGFTALGSLCVGQAGVGCDAGGASNGGTSAIVLNGDSKTNWAAANIESLVHLQPPAVAPDSGAADLNGPSSAIAPFALKGQAGQQSGGVASYGIKGVAASIDAGFAGGVDSAGVVGRETSGLASHYGLYATKGSGSATAAYFTGNVRVVGGSAQSDLIVGSIGQGVINARNDGVSEICLNDVCRADWPLGGTSQWTFYGPTNTLWPGSTSRDWSLANGQFIVKNQANLTVDVTIGGASKFRSLVVGIPTGLVNSCGDGICSATESVGTCALDCDTLPPGAVSNLIEGFYNVSTRVLSLNWTLPIDADLAGTKVIQNALVPATSPNESGTLVPDPTATFLSSPLQPGQQYYFTLYAYDEAGNFASGVEFPFTAP